MENASKALIIAGAILLSILLISLGIMVYNNAKGTVNEANLDSEATQTFNSKFTQYTGSNKSASDVNALVNAVNANNAANGTTRIQISISGLTARYSLYWRRETKSHKRSGWLLYLCILKCISLQSNIYDFTKS